MICLRKVFGDELMNFALLLTLLRINPQYYFESDWYHFEIDSVYSNNGVGRGLYSSRNLIRHIHPKNYDSYLLSYERELFAELNSLKQYSPHQNPIAAYLLNIDRPSELGDLGFNLTTNTESPPEQPQQNAYQDCDNTNSVLDLNGDLGLTQEDMDLIEVLWKQDVDLGFSLQQQELEAKNLEEDIKSPSCVSLHGDDDVEKLKALQAINEDIVKEETEEFTNSRSWSALNYTIDTETGEYVIKTETEQSLSATDCEPSCSIPLGDLSLQLPEFLLDEAIQLVGLDDEISQSTKTVQSENSLEETLPSSVAVINSTLADELNSSIVAIETNTVSAAENLTSDESTAKLIKDLQADDDLSILADMIQTTQFHHTHHRAFQGRMPFVRTMSMEQRWQDLASLLSLQNPNDTSAMPHHFSHHHHPLHGYGHPHSHTIGYNPDTREVLLHNATLAPPMGDLNSSLPYSNLGGTNLGNAVATSMNLTNSSEPMAEPTSTSHYKLEPTHDMMYYQNVSSELNQNDGFLSSILNDEDLQLMDMAMNEGMYTMRMLDTNNTLNSNLTMGAASGTTSRIDMERLDTSSDSAVSSMGSERVPSLSDGEWCDAGSDSGHTPGDHYVDYHIPKYRPYDYSYANRQPSTTLGNSDSSRIQPVAQKKHQMFGKRYLQEQSGANNVTHSSPTPIKYEYGDSGTSFNSIDHMESIIGAKPQETKYSCGIEYNRNSQINRNPISHIQHNHSYHLPAENIGALQRPLLRDKLKGHKSNEEHLSRDEKRARALQVPISVDDIINLPMDEFNERLSKYDLSENQLSLIRDIRRRGKNKVAAQNCRKRKLDQILNLADEVKEIRDRKLRMLSEQDFILAERRRIKDKYQQLYRHVFQNLRDPDGNPYSPYQYSLQTSADGSILIVPRANGTTPNNSERKDPSHQNQKQ